MTKDDVLFGYRQQLFAEAARTSVTEACRTFGVHRSTYYAWKRQVDRYGLEMLRPRERRRAEDAQPAARSWSRSGSSASRSPTRASGPSASPSELRPREVGRDRRLAERGLEGALPPRPEHPRQALRAGRRLRRPLRAAPRSRPRAPHRRRPPRRAGRDRLLLRRLPEGHRGLDLAADRDRRRLLVCLGRAGGLQAVNPGSPSAKQTSSLARRVARELKAAGWRLERLLSDNGNEFKGEFTKTVERLKAKHTRIHAGRPQTNGNVEALHKTILDECWRPAFARYMQPRLTGLRRELETYLRFYNYDRVHHGRLTGGQIPADIVYGARKMEVR